MTSSEINSNTLYLIYDDECPLCRNTAHALNIKKAVGDLVLLNARESHPMVAAAYAKGFDPDVGIVVIYGDSYYFGADAAHFLALLNSSSSTLNSIGASLFKVKPFAKLLYPVVKTLRRLFIKIKGVGAIEQNQGQPLFARVLGDDWQKLSPFMQKRFANRPYTSDMVLVKGAMTIRSSKWMNLVKPSLKMSGALIQQDGENIPVTVQFKSEPNSARYWFVRDFQF